MGVYSLSFKPSIEKDLRKIPVSTSRFILKKIEQIQANPVSSKSLKLAGSSDFYRIRVGDYRVIYSVDHRAREIMVHYIRHRGDVYRSL